MKLESSDLELESERYTIFKIKNVLDSNLRKIKNTKN